MAVQAAWENIRSPGRGGGIGAECHSAAWWWRRCLQVRLVLAVKATYNNATFHAPSPPLLLYRHLMTNLLIRHYCILSSQSQGDFFVRSQNVATDLWQVAVLNFWLQQQVQSTKFNRILPCYVQILENICTTSVTGPYFKNLQLMGQGLFNM
jgi:hypothetical protein